MTHKERYLKALRHEEPDCVPCAPELWFLVPARMSGLRFYEVSPGPVFLPQLHKIPLWKAQLDCARTFDVCGWIVVFPKINNPALREESRVVFREDQAVEIHFLRSAGKSVFEEVLLAPQDDAPWLASRPVKRFEDWEEYKGVAFVDPLRVETEEIEEAYELTGDSGIVSVAIGGLFFDFLISSREGGLEKVLEDLLEHPSFFERLHREFIEHSKERVKALCKATTKFDELFIGCSYASIPILSPKMYREWEVPFLEEMAQTAHSFGKPLHLHQHGRLKDIIADIARTGVDLLCPLEVPPLGDVELRWVKREFGDKLALKGGVRPQILCQGTPEEIEKEVEECIRQAAEGGGFILGTGDQVHRDTPLKNIVLMRELCKRYGKYPIGGKLR